MSGSAPCDLLAAETALDLVEARLAAELPAHMRAFARAHAEGRPAPAAPPLARAASTLKTARDAFMHELLADRGLALLRLVAPLAIEDAPAVTAARDAAPSWDALSHLAAARDRVAQARFGTGAIGLLHTLHGTAGLAGSSIADADPGPPIAAWRERDHAVDVAEIEAVWQAIATRFGVTGAVQIERSDAAPPRAFVVEPRREVIVVVPAAVDTPYARFAVLHELGHAVVALALAPGVPRVVDEAVASYVARLAEPPTWLPDRWGSSLATAARARRLALASRLNRVERALPATPEAGERPGRLPPWALWHDPGAQAAYVAAEALADQLVSELGHAPSAGDLVRAIVAERDRIDHRTRL